MLPSFLLALREGLEIALIVGLVFGALHQFKRKDLFATVNLGIFFAILASAGIAVLLNMVGASLEGDSEAIFEGTMMWTAAGVLTWMILWMQARAGRIKQLIQDDVSLASKAGKLSLFVVAFIAVVREGIELALFFTASVFTSNLAQTAAGTFVGLGFAALVGWGLYRATIQLNLKRFFQVTSLLLILFAAGLVAHGTHEFNEVGLIPGIVAPVWDMNSTLDENSIPGQILKTLFGYNGNPSLTELFSYLLYFTVLFFATRPKRVHVVAGDQATT